VPLLLAHHGETDIDSPDNDGVTPLHMAAYHGCMRGAELLVAAHANLDALDSKENSPEAVATQLGHKAVADMLARARAVAESVPVPEAVFAALEQNGGTTNDLGVAILEARQQGYGASEHVQRAVSCYERRVSEEDPNLERFFGSNELVCPETPAVFSRELRNAAANKAPANHDVKYWGGAPQPWRNGTTDEPIDDAEVIAREERFKAAAEEKDASSLTRLRDRGIRIDVLLHLTFELNLWKWRTWEVVQFLVKPVTEANGRCRFAELPDIAPWTGPATVFISHCWGGLWGDLVAAACVGGRRDRKVWIDIVSVRQWPGNFADLSFQQVILECTAMIVAAAPVGGTVCTRVLRKVSTTQDQMVDYKKSPEFVAVKRNLPFCRLWCAVELSAAAQSKVPILFQVVSAAREMGSGLPRVSISRKGAGVMLANFARIVDIEESECSVQADYVREMALIVASEGGIRALTGEVRRALKAGLVAHERGIYQLSACACGERSALRTLSADQTLSGFETACAFGRLEEAVELLVTRHTQIGPLSTRPMPLLLAAREGRLDVLNLLLRLGSKVDSPQRYSSADEHDETSALAAACGGGHADIVCALLAAGAKIEGTEKTGHPLLEASSEGQLEVMELLLNAGADPERELRTLTPLYQAVSHGQIAAVRSLLAAGANPNRRRCPQRALALMASPLGLASLLGATEIVTALLDAGADPNALCRNSNDDIFPVHLAVERGFPRTVRALIAGGADVNLGRESALSKALKMPGSSRELVEVLVEGGARLESNVLGQSLESHGVTWSGQDNRTHMSASEQDSKRAISRFLLQAGGDPQGLWSCRSPLGIACQQGFNAMVEDLLKAGVDPNAPSTMSTCTKARGMIRDRFGTTPLHEAIRNDHIETVKILLSAGADPEKARGDAETRDKSPLLLAASLGCLGVVEALLLGGADANAVHPYFGGAVCAAVEHGHLDVVMALLAAGADLKATRFGLSLPELAYECHRRFETLDAHSAFIEEIRRLTEISPT
jgi:ankyrin repeat protein